MIYDNDNCNETEQVFTVPIIKDTNKTEFQLPSGGSSIKYERKLPAEIRSIEETTASKTVQPRQEDPCMLNTSLFDCQNPEVWCRDNCSPTEKAVFE